MLNKKFILAKLLIFISTVITFFLTDLPFLFAAAQLFEADGISTMGDTGVDNEEVVREKAKERALRNAIEKAGVVIESVSEMKDNHLTKDYIKIFSKAYSKIEDIQITKEIVSDKDIAVTKFKCHVKVWIDPNEIGKNLSNTPIEKLEDQVKLNKDQETYIEKNEKESLKLREQYKNAADDNERQKVATAIKRNEEQFTASQLYQRGADCYSKGNLAEAINFYNQAVATDNKYAAPLTGLGWIYNDQAQYSKAIECFQKSIALYSDIAVPYNGLSYAYNYSNEFNKAIEYGNKAVQIDSQYAAAWNNIGFAYNNLGNYSKAIEYYNKAISIAPNDEIPFANIGNVYYKQKDFAKALEYYKKSININATHASVWYNLGNIYGQKGEIDKAVDSYKKVTELDPKNIRAWIMAGYLNNQQKDFEEAKRCFKKAFKLNPNSASAWAGLGFAYDGSEDYSNSLEAYKKAVELEPDNENYKKNLETAKQKL